ncbi:adenylosuccinate synthase [Gammaproteobacteria bacterium]|nr:adenylosuccinate synthase [Gammaproteobacteria bacterium]
MTFSNTAILGLQWGDEGKGKIVNYLASNFGAACRYQGGHNAGHTLIVDGKKIVLHLLPSSICHKDSLSLIGKGVVISYEALFSEIDEISNFTSGITDRLKISPACVLIQPYHQLIDIYKEKSNSQKTIGTTLRGIGPAYEDKVARRAIRVVDTLHENQLRPLLEETLDFYNFTIEKFFGEEALSLNSLIDENLAYGEKIKPMLADVSMLIKKINSEKQSVLFEGAQGALLDIDQGTYPFVTSSNCSPSGIAAGAGCGPLDVVNILGVVKAYVTRVGEGPMPTEIYDELGEYIAKTGGEVGATTGRPRRCGWFDGVLMKRIIQTNSISGLCLTKIDVLDGLDEIKICSAYKDESDSIFGECMNLENINPVYETLSGWESPTKNLTNYEELPSEAKDFISYIEDICEVPVKIISTGPDDQSTIVK